MSSDTSDNTIVDHFVSAVLDNVFVGTIFRIHRDFTINKLIGLRECNDDEEEEDEKGNDGAGSSTANIEERGGVGGRQNAKKTALSDPLRGRSIECRCFVCNRMIAAVRFAPHLEKCIGIGKSTRTRRRVHVTNYAAESTYAAAMPTTSRTTRASTLRSATKMAEAANSNNISDWSFPIETNRNNGIQENGRENLVALEEEEEKNSVLSERTEHFVGAEGGEGPAFPLRDKIRQQKPFSAASIGASSSRVQKRLGS